ncbi:hypothetical protein [Oleidesulfovibrio sp.]|uniref:hypothetical protein n=1 Tax=Oleidesulfovibrio sp. TaxID=2909707 RepID=UPI003A83DB5C
MDIKQLSDKHPLYSRLTGQVIWVLFEENDAEQDDIDTFMDLCLKRKERDLQVMQTLLDNPSLYLKVQIEDIPCLSGSEGCCKTKHPDLPPPCECCVALDGRVLPASHPELLKYLPPYGLGCRCTPKAVTAAEAADAPPLTDASLPLRKLHCDSGWLFHMHWKEQSA